MRHMIIGFGMALLLSGCGDPLRDVARLDDVAASDATATATQTPAEARNRGGGLFSRLLNRAPDDPTNAAVEAALADAGTVEGEEAQADEAVPETVAQEAPARRGLFGLFRGNRSTDDRTAAVANSADAETEATQAAVQTPEPAAVPRRGLGGIFRRGPGASNAPRNGPDAADVEPSTVLPMGQIARVCGLRRNQLGRAVGEGGGFTLYDSIPNSTARRPFYITGFDDNCARTFTGAVAVAGDIATHEFVRYQGSNERIDYTSTDNAYEALKARTCRVGRGQPCGERADRLNRSTLFVTVYDFFGGTFSAVPTEWGQILLHDGSVVSMSVKNG